LVPGPNSRVSPCQVPMHQTKTSDCKEQRKEIYYPSQPQEEAQ
jgi:hypothetical protein